ncbi:MAG: cupin domain-containing protein [Deltaproteobacteria bacterium]|nr:cupin domain-containing protein [Deltaproteobacteria bacterium]
MASSISQSVPTLGGRTSYQKFFMEEGIDSVSGLGVRDMKNMPLKPWRRMGGYGVYIDLDGTILKGEATVGQTNNAYICEIAPGGSLTPQRHIFEELIFVLSGRGATTVWMSEGKKQTLEWQEGSLFSPPLNAWYQHFNGSGDKPARFLAVTNMPLILNLFHNYDFIFNNGFAFTDRYSGEEDYFSGKGKAYPGRVWDTNFIADVYGFKLMEWRERGAGGATILFEIANNTMCAHISEFPAGTYKKAHRHGPGAHVIILSGRGYSLLWPEGGKKKKFDWSAGSMVVPPDRWFHQHFNTGKEPARYLALRWGSRKFSTAPEEEKLAKSVALGGDQIEYEDEDEDIYALFRSDCAKSGFEVTWSPSSVK